MSVVKMPSSSRQRKDKQVNFSFTIFYLHSSFYARSNLPEYNEDQTTWVGGTYRWRWKMPLLQEEVLALLHSSTES
jgi:hypothetical protein